MTRIQDKIRMRGILEVYERRTGATEWTLVRKVHNLITTVGFNCVVNRLTGQGTYASTTFTYFAWSNGTLTPNVSDTAATFNGDGTVDTKAVNVIEAFSTSTLTQVWTCFLSSTDNAVASITKFALMNADPGTIMFEETKFPAISKDSNKELYFRYSLIMSEG